MLGVELEHLESVECSVCDREDEGIHLDVDFGDADCSVLVDIFICESCWAEQFKSFKKEK